MYDRVSLAVLLTQTGFDRPIACRAEERQIDVFDPYRLDRAEALFRKPDLLYIEARKMQSQGITCETTLPMITKAA